MKTKKTSTNFALPIEYQYVEAAAGVSVSTIGRTLTRRIISDRKEHTATSVAYIKSLVEMTREYISAGGKPTARKYKKKPEGIVTLTLYDPDVLSGNDIGKVISKVFADATDGDGNSADLVTKLVKAGETK